MTEFIPYISTLSFSICVLLELLSTLSFIEYKLYFNQYCP